MHKRNVRTQSDSQKSKKHTITDIPTHATHISRAWRMIMVIITIVRQLNNRKKTRCSAVWLGRWKILCEYTWSLGALSSLYDDRSASVSAALLGGPSPHAMMSVIVARTNGWSDLARMAGTTATALAPNEFVTPGRESTCGSEIFRCITVARFKRVRWMLNNAHGMEIVVYYVIRFALDSIYTI